MRHGRDALEDCIARTHRIETNGTSLERSLRGRITRVPSITEDKETTEKTNQVRKKEHKLKLLDLDIFR